MKVLLVADTFPPSRNSGAVQLRDLAREFTRQGHQVTVMLPSASQSVAWLIEDVDGVQVLRLKAPKTKDISYIRRTLGEIIMPWAMLWNLKKSPLAKDKWDGLVWYVPSIFFGPLVRKIMRTSSCKGYLIVRDIFPEWVVDMGLMHKGLAYKFFSWIAGHQYKLANTIGVQSKGNLIYFDKIYESEAKVEVLFNWLAQPNPVKSVFRLEESVLSGRKVFVYAGNMGIAQGMDILIGLAEKFLPRNDVGFIFVGRGSELKRLRLKALDLKLDNVLFLDEISSDEILDIYRQCAVGLVSLDARHKSHNIPGKFLSYLQSGLPVIASVNSGNDLIDLINSEKIGIACGNNDLEELFVISRNILIEIDSGFDFQHQCRNVFLKYFSVEKAVRQIIKGVK